MSFVPEPDKSTSETAAVMRLLFALTVPMLAAVAVALPFWRKDRAMLGNIIGSGIILIVPIFLAVAERVDVERLELACVEAGRYCPMSVPSLFRRMAVYGLIAFVEVAALFMIGLIVEERRRRQHVDPEWR